jgi:hypothetical protein
MVLQESEIKNKLKIEEEKEFTRRRHRRNLCNKECKSSRQIRQCQSSFTNDSKQLCK